MPVSGLRVAKLHLKAISDKSIVIPAPMASNDPLPLQPAERRPNDHIIPVVFERIITKDIHMSCIATTSKT